MSYQFPDDGRHHPLPGAPEGATGWCDADQQYCGGENPVTGEDIKCGHCAGAEAPKTGDGEHVVGDKESLPEGSVANPGDTDGQSEPPGDDSGVQVVHASGDGGQPQDQEQPQS